MLRRLQQLHKEVQLGLASVPHAQIVVHVYRNTLAERDENFQKRIDGIGCDGFSMLQEFSAVIWGLEYGFVANLFDQYPHISETIGRQCIKKFCHRFVEAFGNTYL